MTIPLWCLLVVALIPYILAGVGGYYRAKQFGSVDNNDPRVQYSHMEGPGGRVWAAQQNAWEALGLFTATIVIAHLAGADADKMAIASIVFLVTRILHPILYIANLATLRSIIVGIGLLSCVYMFVLAASAQSAPVQ